MKDHIRKIRATLRSAVYSVQDLVDLLTGKSDSSIPPRRLRVMVGPCGEAGLFKAVGEEFLRFFINECSLKPNEAVLDVGCGCGQVAIPLTKYLDKRGRYEGFDLEKAMVKWCADNVSSKYPNFNFQVADVFNGVYNPKGKYKAHQYKFPYENETFDLIFLKSVFTHLLPLDMENYLSEISRVLKKGGRCLITYFLLDEESLEAIGSGSSTLDFRYVFDNHRIVNETFPESAVAYDKGYILGLYRKLGLSVEAQPYRGSWARSIQKNYSGYQDMVLASKK